MGRISGQSNPEVRGVEAEAGCGEPSGIRAESGGGLGLRHRDADGDDVREGL